MIVDITNEVLTALKTALTNITVIAEYPKTASSFPCVTVSEISNTEDMDTVDTSGTKHSTVSLEINIFSNAQNKTTQVKSIRNQIDTILSGTYRMTRGFSGVTPNPSDIDVYRYTLRYTFRIDKNKMIYRG